jgi:molecular chaperone DnaJ
VSNLYAVLGVERTADTDTIKHAYRELARRHHPDSGGESRIMAELNEAWHVLGDADRRASYDWQTLRPKPRPGRRDGHTVMDYGRYDGWSLAEIARSDDDYLEWLRRTQTGRPLRKEIGEILAERAAAIEALRPAPPQTRKRMWGRA